MAASRLTEPIWKRICPPVWIKRFVSTFRAKRTRRLIWTACGENCTRNEFVEKALRQYCGRLHAERTSAYLPRALQEMLEGTLGVFGDRLGKLLFKLVVEHNMTNHLLGGDIDMTRDEYNKMRGNSVREVAGTHGNISFRDVLLFHREE